VRISLFICALALALSAAPTNADEPELLTGVVDTVEVVEERLSPAAEIGALSTFATVHEIVQSAPIENVAAVVERGAAVHVRRYGGLGSLAAVSIRGSSPSQVEVYLDGVPLQSSPWGVTNLADLPVGGLERVEVYRGGAPAGFGTAGIGGVVNLVTSPAGAPGLTSSFAVGSFGAQAAAGRVAGRLGAVDYSLSVRRLESRGDFEYLDRHGTPENESDDVVVERGNNHLRQTNALLRLDAEAGGWRFEFADDLLLKAKGIPGTESVHVASAHSDVGRNFVRASIEPPAPAAGLKLKSKLFHQYRRDRFWNPKQEVGLPRSGTDDRSWSYGGNAQVEFAWHRARQRLCAFGELRLERYIPEDKNPAVGMGFTRRRRSSTGMLEDRLFLLGDRLEIVGAYRYQEATDNYAGPIPFGAPPAPRDEPHWSVFHGPRFGGRVRVLPRLIVKANATRYARFPSMLELFGASGTVDSNPELEPEEGRTLDAGIVAGPVQRGRLTCFAEVSVFEAERENLIVFIENSQRTVKAFNLESARVRGVETAVRAEGPGGIRLACAYTYQDARNTGPSPTYEGKALPYTPAHDGMIRASWAGDAARLEYELHYQSESYRDRANQPENRSPERLLHNVTTRLGTAAVAVALEVENVTDVRTYDVEGYPLPGRTIYVTLEISGLRSASRRSR